MEKAAYVAVGAPVAALKAMSARVNEIRDTVRSSREEMGEELSDEIDEWIAMGEEVIERAIQRVRGSGAARQLRSSTQATKQAARVGIEKASRAAESGFDLIEPNEDLTTIDGIGAGHASKLRNAGVSGVAGLLERTETDEASRSLADATGLSADMIASWRGQADLSRVEGVGDSYQHLLHRAGVWTLAQLAEAAPAELVERMRSVELPDVPGQKPSEEMVEDWQAKAAKLR